MTLRGWICVLLVAVAPLSSGTARAASAPGSGAAPALLAPEEALAFAEQVQERLAREGARVALVFRTGRPRERLPEGIAYTHGALWVYQAVRTPEGDVVPGYTVHNLYHHETERRRSYLHQDWPLDFVAPSAVDDVGVIVPTLELQRRVHELLGSPAYGALHQSDYSLISNPHDARYQNCNEFLLDVLTAALYDTTDRERLKEIQRQHFEPAELRVNPFARLLGPVFDERVRLGDQHGTPRTVTYASLGRWLEENDLLAARFRIERTGGAALARAEGE